MKARLENCIKDINGVYHVTFTTKENAGAVYDEYNDKDVEITVSKPQKKRSLDANAYMWELCGQIADKLSNDGVLYTKEDVYRQNIRNAGIYKDIPLFSEGVDTMRAAWERHGTGWVTEIVDYLPGKIGYLVRCYFGSSEYNTKQMCRLIDSVVQDAKSVGIDTRTPDEIANMLSLWEQAVKKENKHV